MDICINGSRWWKIDFHVHSPASADYGHGDESARNITERDWIRGAKEKKLDAAVVTDHNTGDWVDRLVNELKEIEEEEQKPEWYHPLSIFPGVEISADGGSERVHLLAIFNPWRTTSEINGVLGACGITTGFGTPEGATYKSIADIVAAVKKAEGIVIGAHVDGPKGVLNGVNSLTDQLRAQLRCLSALEVCGDHLDESLSKEREIKRLAKIRGSDAHFATDIGSVYAWVKMGKATVPSLQLALRDNVFCVKDGSLADPNRTPDFYIESLSISNFKLCGRGDDGATNLLFSPNFSAIIGGRGSGKSTAIESARIAFNRVDERFLPSELAPRLLTFKEKMLLPESLIEVIFYSHGSRYRLQYSNENQQFDLSEFVEWDWLGVDLGDVATRFPVWIYSQKQLFELANRPNGLLALVDEAINSNVWRDKWNQTRGEYLRCCVTARELRDRVNSMVNLETQLSDLDKKITEYQSRGYGDVLRRIHEVRREDAAIRANPDVSLIKGELQKCLPVIEDIKFPEAEFASCSDELKGEIRVAYETLATSVNEFLDTVKKSISNIDAAMRMFGKKIELSQWNAVRLETEKSYQETFEALKEKGVAFDAGLYNRWLAEREALKAKIVEKRRLEQEKIQNLQKLRDAHSRLLDLRQQHAKERNEFLKATLNGNKYVRMTVLPFGDTATMEEDMREILGIEQDRFRDAFYNEENRGGLLAELVNWQSDNVSVEDLPEKIKSVKSILWAAAHNNCTSLPKSFVKRIETIYSTQESKINEIMAYWPEDKLVVEYSSGNGDFHSIEDGSPGQKSAAILAFLLGYGTSPLIIDQPEDDLDNSLIMSLVVNQLRVNKARRQVIVATHNANVVVNGDAEQVIAMKYMNGQLKPYAQGSLDDQATRSAVCNIMEGGQRALQKRCDRMLGVSLT